LAKASRLIILRDETAGMFESFIEYSNAAVFFLFWAVVIFSVSTALLLVICCAFASLARILYLPIQYFRHAAALKRVTDREKNPRIGLSIKSFGPDPRETAWWRWMS
jgi:hypothetical protein